MKRILHITPNFNYNCGRSKLVFLHLKYFGRKEGYEVHFITNGGDSLERLKETVPEYKILKFSTGLKNVFYQRRFLNELKNYITENKIQLIHTHHRFPEYMAVKTAKELKVKTVASVHNFVKGYKNISFRSDRLICVSSCVSSYLQKNFGVEKERLITMYNPIEIHPQPSDEEISELRRLLEVKSRDKIILFMGRISYEKGFDVLLNAIPIIKKEYPDFLLLICGNAKSKKFLKDMEKAGNSLKLCSSGNNKNLFYAASDLVVLPSRVDSFPYVMLEAGMYAKAFIGGDTGGISEFIEDGINGLLASPGNPDILSEKIIHLLKNQDTAEILGKNLFKKVNEQCNHDNYFLMVENIYDSVLNS